MQSSKIVKKRKNSMYRADQKPLTDHLSVSFHPELKVALKVKAAQHRITISQFVHILMCAALERDDLKDQGVKS